MAFIEMDFATGGGVSYGNERVIVDDIKMSAGRATTFTVPTEINNNNIISIEVIQVHPSTGTAQSVYVRDYKHHKLFYVDTFRNSSTSAHSISELTELDWNAINADGSTKIYAPPTELGETFQIYGQGSSASYSCRVIYYFED